MSMVLAGFMGAAREDRLKREDNEADLKKQEEAFKQQLKLTGITKYQEQEAEAKKNAKAARTLLSTLSGVEGITYDDMFSMVETMGVDGVMSLHENGRLRPNTGTSGGGGLTGAGIDWNAGQGFKPMLDETDMRYGLPQDYLFTVAAVESGFKPRKNEAGSPADGWFQIMPDTAKAYGVSNVYDMEESAEGMGKFSAENMRTLEGVLGRKPTGAELYLAHQQGGGGASALLKNPNALAVDALSGLDGINPREKVRQNLPSNMRDQVDSITAGEFAALWTGKFNRIASMDDTSGINPDTGNVQGDVINPGELDTGRTGTVSAMNSDTSETSSSRSSIRIGTKAASKADINDLIGMDAIEQSQWLEANGDGLEPQDRATANRMMALTEKSNKDPEYWQDAEEIRNWSSGEIDMAIAVETGRGNTQAVEGLTNLRDIAVANEQKGKDYWDLGSVREGNYASLAEAAREDGHEEQAVRIEKLGKTYKDNGVDVNDQKYVGQYRNEQGLLVGGRLAGTAEPDVFVDTSTGEMVTREQFERLTTVEEGEEAEKALRGLYNDTLADLKADRSSLTTMLRSAENLDAMVAANDGVLTFTGNAGSQFVNSLRENLSVLDEMVSGGMTEEEFVSAAGEKLGVVEGQANDAAQFQSEMLRFAYNYASIGLGQSGQGLSDKDFKAALDITQAGDNYSTFSKNLRRLTRESITDVDGRTKLQRNSSPVQGFTDIHPNYAYLIENDVKPVESWLDDGGLGHVYDWAFTRNVEAPEQPSSGGGLGSRTTEPAAAATPDVNEAANTYRGGSTFAADRTVYEQTPDEEKEVWLGIVAKRHSLPIDVVRQMYEGDQ